ncbi:flagellar export chaperone FliS [Parasphingorhabdus cellanae]|uniref:Flagellar protein FliS n=1 Tax=Parasphingorhabdus cellanae TaxID=2806553 RepID=A0ABX7T5S4_9SPHN|nr:flagellar export chaperone FliS [Parasphingorhabdus cellanae]QTD55467.1 flagellar protein FliS [Parasphingorhabdus cellanae]
MTFQSNIRRASSYKSIQKNSNVLSANPYDLVAVLFAELRDSLDLMIESARRNDKGRMFECRAKALSILNGLDESLDFDAAGDLAQTLHTIYVEAARRIQAEIDVSFIERVESAREMLHEIEKAWMAIAPGAQQVDSLRRAS